jgi:hypothetical protein
MQRSSESIACLAAALAKAQAELDQSAPQPSSSSLARQPVGPRRWH